LFISITHNTLLLPELNVKLVTVQFKTYEIQKQFAPLTMGWCIDCHSKTDVKMEGNEYYKKIHEELSKKYGVDKLTAAQMGGLECGKCHY
jgi:hypothetical protein